MTASDVPAQGAATAVLERPPTAAPPIFHGSTALSLLPAAAPPPPSTIDKLRDGIIARPLTGWLITLAITALAFGIRFVHLGRPANLVFDETYYAKDAWALLHSGFERIWGDQANERILAGDLSVMSRDAAFVVHPPVGKWLIGFGEQLFGMNSFGWRFSALLFGTALVFVTIRLARRLSRSNLVGAIAGLLLTFDGLAFTMSRIALLDIFQAFFLVAAVSCIVADRDYYRLKLAAHLLATKQADLAGHFGPVIWGRPWLTLAGVFFGLACGTKWNSVYVLAVFGVLTVLWSVSARRLAGAGWASARAFLVDGAPAFVRLVVISAAVYLATWTGWFASATGWDRTWGAEHPQHVFVRWFGTDLGSWLYYHKEIYAFHTGDFINHATHPYEAHPAGWLFMVRPIGIDAVNNIQPGVDGCLGPATCLRVVSGLGTPVLWWCAALALFVSIVWWIARRDWRFSVPVLGALATYLPWFAYTARPLFFFYAITIIPFTVIGLSMVLGLLIGPGRPPGAPVSAQARRRRLVGCTIAGVVVALVALNFGFIYPILTDQLLTYSQWRLRMWLPTWI